MEGFPRLGKLVGKQAWNSGIPSPLQPHLMLWNCLVFWQLIWQDALLAADVGFVLNQWQMRTFARNATPLTNLPLVQNSSSNRVLLFTPNRLRTNYPRQPGLYLPYFSVAA